MSTTNGDNQQDAPSNPQPLVEAEPEKPYTDQGINEKIVQKIRSLIDLGKLISSDIDNRVCEQLRSFPDDATCIDSLFNEFNDSDLTGVVNKGAFLCNFIKQWKLRNPQQPKLSSNDPQSSQGFGENARTHKPGPDEAKLKLILERTGYKTEVTAGQRKYGGPPPDGPERPASRSEVFIGKLPREIFEDELIPLCEKAGKIWDLRLMIDPASGFNKGYCFVTYCCQGQSTKACEQLNGYEIRPGKPIKANCSVANLRLFIGNIPKTKSKEEIKEELGKAVEGVNEVIIYTPADEADKKKNRGFCFVDFDTHKNASAAKRKLANGRVRVFNRDIAVDWADPDEEPDEDIMSQVKVLYVRNLTSDVSENDVKDFFLPYGNIERVRKVRDYAFVHFDKRDDALNAMRALNGKLLGRNTIEVSLAKPLSDKRKQAQTKREQRKPFDGPVNPRNNFDNNSSSGFGGGSSSGGFGGFDSDLPRGSGGRSDNSFNVNNFGAFGGDNFMGSGPTQTPPPPPPSSSSSSSRGVSSQRGNNRGGRSGGDRGGYSGNNRGGGFNSGNRGGSGNFNQNNRGGYNNNNNSYRGNHGGPSQHNNSGGYNNNSGFNQMGGGFNSRGDFGAFNSPSQNNNNNNNNNNQSFGRPSNQMGMGNSGFGMNQMHQNQSYGGMKRPPNQMNDGNMSKRSRPDTGSWGAMGGDSNDNSNSGPQQQQQNAGGNWYQDQGYSSSQQQSSYSWN
ncbi:unnamed protein product [Rotaria socialis]|uniref:RRM domain-containing protein n=1 Tax=Rotaria socialis TaxID=392032 RepID=A0A821MA18_9BILA|nr:unnamed protein product [Rotaria socialis]CAF3459362.1 unnamed protein product [Rotaria socialis]CAF3515448.1 unnamed protein product [Rotaria socialis]CAF4373880.1 unnamed protein product [Rotaria socialis]CAF4498383.1 unnamed protein product [Rotaria socialis]